MLDKTITAFIIIVSATLFIGCDSATSYRPFDVDSFSRPVRVACVGDSITYGSKISYRPENSYPAVLGRMLGSRWQVKNFGVSGATMLKNGNKPYWDTKFDECLEFAPDIVIIKLGTNDSKGFNWKYKSRFIPDYQAMINTFNQLETKPRIWIALPVPVYQDGQFEISKSVVRDEIVPQLRLLARRNNLPVIDLYQALSDKPELFRDGIHPNTKGAQLMAEEVYRALTGKFWDVTVQLDATGGF